MGRSHTGSLQVLVTLGTGSNLSEHHDTADSIQPSLFRATKDWAMPILGT